MPLSPPQRSPQWMLLLLLPPLPRKPLLMLPLLPQKLQPMPPWLPLLLHLVLSRSLKAQLTPLPLPVQLVLPPLV